VTSVEARRPVVVGVDGSEPSLAAADLAAAEAARRELPLELVHAYLLPMPMRTAAATPDIAPMVPSGEVEAGDAVLRDHAQRLLHAAAGRVRAAYPDLPMTSRLRDGRPAEVLTEASRQASIVVVGHRGTGGFAGLLTGSVAIQLANHAATPVIVVRGERRDTGPVVVGVDGSEGARRAAAFAVEQAAVHKTAVIALYAADGATEPALAQMGQPPPEVPAEVTETLAVATGEYPWVVVESQVRTGRPAHELLVEASANARLVVVGSRGRGGFRGLLLGSISQALINHAHCPIAVVGPGAEVA
jgi:nucleotide-binding universal stress UspA family protein